MILYLPPGPLFPPPAELETESAPGPDTSTDTVAKRPKKRKPKPRPRLTPQRILASATLSTVVTVNYRLDRESNDDSGHTAHKYPTPVHDTLIGFDWVLRHLKPKKLCVFGTHIGGSLAVMLALTEPRSLVAVAAREPMCDWVGLDDYCQIRSEGVAEAENNGDGNSDEGKPVSTVAEPEGETPPAPNNHRRRGRKKKPAPPDLVPLLESRNLFFRKPENYFDSFASPALFLRSPGKTPPKAFPTYLTGPEYPVPILQKPTTTTPNEEEDAWYAELLADEDPDLDLLPEQVDEEAGGRTSSASLKTVRRRKVLARWPPFGLDYGLDSYSANPDAPVADPRPLALPPVRIFVHGDVKDGGAATAMDQDEQLAAKLEAAKLDNEAPAAPAAEDANPSPEQGSPATKPRPRGPITEVAKSTTGETVLARQGAEMVSLMHHACFWGQPLGYGEERVQLVQGPVSAPGTEQKEDDYWIERQAGELFVDTLNEVGGEESGNVRGEGSKE